MRSLQVVLLVCIFALQAWSQNYNRQSNFGGFNNYNPQDQPPQRSYSGGSCPEPNGTYPTSTCDGYIECKNGVPEEKLCPDGLLFNPATGPRSYPCQYPIDVDCTGRTQTQPPQATDECPHQFGYYLIGDSSNCGQFKNCVDGRAFIFDCPEGLAFNGETYRCDWPDQVSTCDAESYLRFSCPPEAKGFLQAEYRYFRSPDDCQRYYICVNGRPRLYNCGEGRAFNELINQCDGIENVTSCAGSAQYQNSFDRSSIPVRIQHNSNLVVTQTQYRG